MNRRITKDQINELRIAIENSKQYDQCETVGITADARDIKAEAARLTGDADIVSVRLSEGGTQICGKDWNIVAPTWY